MHKGKTKCFCFSYFNDNCDTLSKKDGEMYDESGYRFKCL